MIHNTKFKWKVTVAAIASAMITACSSAASYAWGPERTTFTMDNPADYVTFNSITDNNIVGDERNFVRVGEVGSNTSVSDEVKVTPGKTYQVWVFYHNDAKSSLNASGKGIANGVTISSDYSKTISSASKGTVSAILSSASATPAQVWDEAYFTTDSKESIKLEYVAGSAKIYNDGYATNGAVLSESLFKSDTGVLIGVNKLDGRLPACSEYSGHIVYNLYASQVGASVKKTASLDGINFFDSVEAKPGDTVTYKVEFTNSGTSDLTTVTIHDKMPTGVTLVPGTTILTNSSHPNGLTMDDLIGQNGYKIGNYAPGEKATIVYQVTVNSNINEKATCGKTSYKNTAYIDHDDGEIYDSSTIIVDKICLDEETPDELPKTGPGEIVIAVVAVACVAVGGIYWYQSQKEVIALQNEIKSSKKGKK